MLDGPEFQLGINRCKGLWVSSFPNLNGRLLIISWLPCVHNIIAVERLLLKPRQCVGYRQKESRDVSEVDSSSQRLDSELKAKGILTWLVFCSSVFLNAVKHWTARLLETYR